MFKRKMALAVLCAHILFIVGCGTTNTTTPTPGSSEGTVGPHMPIQEQQNQTDNQDQDEQQSDTEETIPSTQDDESSEGVVGEADEAEIYEIVALTESQILDLATQGNAPADYSNARYRMKSMYNEDSGTRATIYCGCSYGADEKIDWDSCGFTPRATTADGFGGDPLVRAKRMEADHIVPASWIGGFRACWQEGGRSNCQQNDDVYNVMAGDLVNLRPSIGQVNADRLDFAYGDIEGEPYQYGACPMTVDTRLERAEPRNEIKGDLARITLYMAQKYSIYMPSYYLAQMEQWAANDPVSTVECVINNEIEAIQGFGNPLVAKGC